MNKHLSVLTDVTAGGGLVIGLQEISTILGIALTACSLFVLIVNFILKLKDRVSNTDKDKDGTISKEELKSLIEEVCVDIQDAKDEYDEITKSYNDENSKDGD
jgi:Mg2+/Co2+ transporter CorB